MYVHFGSDLIEEYDTSGNLRKEWVYGIRIDEPIRMEAPDYADLDGDSNTTEMVDLYYLTNSLGTVTALVDGSGNVVERYVYDVWGVIRDVIDSDGSSTGASWTLVGNPWTYTGRQFEFEERTELYHYRARAYRPEVGQFLQRDPLGVWGDARGGCRAYAAMNPSNRVDGLGLRPYVRGTTDPKLDGGEGAGEHGGKAAEAAFVAAKQAILAGATVGAVSPWSNAWALLEHYMSNTGEPYEVDMDELMQVPKIAKEYRAEKVGAQSYVEAQSDGQFAFTSTEAQTVQLLDTTVAKHPAERDWYYGLGGFSVWGKGVARVRTAANGTRCFFMAFKFQMWDRYNWEKWFEARLPGGMIVGDDTLGEFHRQGLAKEFDVHGEKVEPVK